MQNFYMGSRYSHYRDEVQNTKMGWKDPLCKIYYVSAKYKSIVET